MVMIDDSLLYYDIFFSFIVLPYTPYSMLSYTIANECVHFLSLLYTMNVLYLNILPTFFTTGALLSKLLLLLLAITHLYLLYTVLVVLVLYLLLLCSSILYSSAILTIIFYTATVRNRPTGRISRAPAGLSACGEKTERMRMRY